MKHKAAPVEDTAEAWDARNLGASEEHVGVVDPATEQAVEDALGLQMISIRLPRGLIDAYKALAALHNVGYQPLMRDALSRFAENELKLMAIGAAETKRQQEEASEKPPAAKMKRAA